MESKTIWNEGMQFTSHLGPHEISMDAIAPLGSEKGPAPREVLLSTLASSTGMDIVGLLKKNKQKIEKFEIMTHGELTTHGYPIVFSSIELVYQLFGEIEEYHAREAIHLSHVKFSGVFNMLAGNVPIRWRLFLNGEELNEESVESAGIFLSHE